MIETVQGGVVVKIKTHTAVLGLEIQEESPVTSVIVEADQEEGLTVVVRVMALAVRVTGLALAN